MSIVSACAKSHVLLNLLLTNMYGT